MLSDKCTCDLKEGQEKLISEGDWIDLYIKRGTGKYGEYELIALSDGRASIIISYCPICGKKLKSE